MKKIILAFLLISVIILSACTPSKRDETKINNNEDISNPSTPEAPNAPAAPEEPHTPIVPSEPEKPEEPNEVSDPEEPSEPEKPVIPEKPKNKTIKIVAAGDNLLHNTISFDARRDDGTYDFSSIYTRIAHITSDADIGFINQEIMLTGNISGYPRMEAPDEVADALVAIGFNVINLASNHTLDKGEDGLEACIKNVKERNFDAILGVYETEEESKQVILVEKQGITFGFLSYTYDMNGYKLSEGNEWKVDIIDEPKMVKDMKALRPLCDYLIVSMHWGAEYKTQPTSYQRKLGQLLCDYGADLIIGTHPHVLQPLEVLTSSNGKYSTICAWSLGNFISNQHKLDTMLGGMLQVEVEFDENNDIVKTRSSIIPTVTHYDDNAKNYEVYLLENYTEELASVHGIRKHAESPLTLQHLKDLAQNVIGENIANEIY